MRFYGWTKTFEGLTDTTAPLSSLLHFDFPVGFVLQDGGGSPGRTRPT